MRLYPGKIPAISQEVISRLKEDGDIEVDNAQEAQLDLEAVLKEFLRLDRDLTERAKDLMDQRKLAYNQFARIKRQLSEERGFSTPEESVSYIANQILEVLMHSPNVAEVYADDVVLRKKMQVILKKHMQVDQELDVEVRKRIKNLEEGTAAWELEYQKAMEQVKRKQKLV